MRAWKVSGLPPGGRKMGWLRRVGGWFLHALGRRRKYTAIAGSEVSSEAVSTSTVQSLVEMDTESV